MSTRSYDSPAVSKRDIDSIHREQEGVHMRLRKIETNISNNTRETQKVSDSIESLNERIANNTVESSNTARQLSQLQDLVQSLSEKLENTPPPAPTTNDCSSPIRPFHEFVLPFETPIQLHNSSYGHQANDSVMLLSNTVSEISPSPAEAVLPHDYPHQVNLSTLEEEVILDETSHNKSIQDLGQNTVNPSGNDQSQYFLAKRPILPSPS